MSESPSPTPEASPAPANGSKELLAAIDRSCRFPVLVLVNKAVGWLVLGLVLALIASIKYHGPGFLADYSWLTLGRVRPAAMNALLYGFASQASLALLIWMICRLGRTPLLNGNLIVFATGIWNFALFIGLIAILSGQSTGFQWLEMPGFVAFFLFVAYTLIAVWVLITFHHRRERDSYVSVWYLLGALFWFPWIYSTANYLLLVKPVRGVMQSVVDAWYTNNLLLLWLGPIALASIYYFIPKITGRQLYSRSIALFGFWSMALFACWTGLTQLVGGPLPSWMPSASIAASVLMLIPLLCVVLNWHLTLEGSYGEAKKNTTLGFVVFGAGCYAIGTLESIVLSFRSVSEVTHFTVMRMGWTYLMLLGFVGGALFGGIHYLMPRLLQSDWSAAKMRTHLFLTAGGVALCFLALTVGGFIQGSRIANPDTDFLGAVRSAVPFMGLSTLGLLLILVGQLSLLSKLISLGFRAFLSCCSVNCCSWLSELKPAKKKEIKA